MFKSLSLLMSSTLISSLLTFITQIIIAKNTDPVFFGDFTAALSLVIILSPVMALGSDGYFLRFYAEKKGKIDIFGSSWLLYWLLSLIFCYIIYSCFIKDTPKLFFLLVISQSLLNLSVAYCQSVGNYSSLSVMSAMQSVFRFLLIIVIYIYEGVNINSVYYVYILVSLVVVLLSLRVIRNLKFVNIKICDFKNIVLSSYPYGLSVILHLIYFQSDIFLINKLYSSYEAGLYGVAFTLISAAYLLPSVLYQKFLLPKIYQLELNDKNKQEKIFSRGFLFMLLSSIILFMLFFSLSDYIVGVFFGDNYNDSIIYIKILSICIIFRYLSSNAGVHLMSDFLIRKKNKVMMFCALINIVLNFIFVPFHGALAAAIITVITEAILCFFFYFYINKYKFPILNRVIL